jgi:hypothetical protein
LQTTLKNNLYYSPFPAAGQTLLKLLNWSESVKESNYNLFWRPGPIGSWYSSAVKLGSNDIADPAKRPTFVNEAAGEFSLALGSPGKTAASDGTDIGANFNNFLKKQLMKNIVSLPTQEKTAMGTSISFNTSSAHQYQVYVYIPTNSPSTGVESFAVAGKSIRRDLALLNKGRWLGEDPRRWIYLGTHPNDGTLNISWQRANAAAKFFIRQLPAVAEAYSWIFPVSTPAPILAAPSLLGVLPSLP